MNKLLGNALVVAMFAGLTVPAVASDTSAASLAKDPLVVSGCEERAAEENIPAEGVAAYVQQCLEDLANELPQGEDQEIAKKQPEGEKAQN